MANATAELVGVSSSSLLKGFQGKVHYGFSGYLETLSAGIDAAAAALDNKGPTATLCVTGHSLGGAIAVLAAAALFKCRQDDTSASDGKTESTTPASIVDALCVVTFGQPAVGDEEFARHYEACGLGVRTFRCVIPRDIVPKLPHCLLPQYCHVGTAVFLETRTNAHFQRDLLGIFRCAAMVVELVNGAHGLTEYKRCLLRFLGETSVQSDLKMGAKTSPHVKPAPSSPTTSETAENVPQKYDFARNLHTLVKTGKYVYRSFKPDEKATALQKPGFAGGLMAGGVLGLGVGAVVGGLFSLGLGFYNAYQVTKMRGELSAFKKQSMQQFWEIRGELSEFKKESMQQFYQIHREMGDLKNSIGAIRHAMVIQARQLEYIAKGQSITLENLARIEQKLDYGFADIKRVMEDTEAGRLAGDYFTHWQRLESQCRLVLSSRGSEPQ